MSVAIREQKKVGADVQIKNLYKVYGDIYAANNVSLDIESGKFITLLGPSGSGKTTVLMSIAGFVEPTQGDIQVDGKSIVNKPPHLRNIGMVFQNYALFPHMTVYENIAFPLKMRKFEKNVINEKVSDVLEMVKLSGYESRKINQLSGGQQQRIALARAVVFNPPLLLMDEPLGALDRKLREHMQLELVKIQKALGITVIYVTHDQEEALVMSDSIAILDHGNLLQEGPPSEVYDRPVNHFVADFLGESNFLHGKIDAVQGEDVFITLSAGQKIEATLRGNLQNGEPVRCVIRPESMKVKSKADDNEMHITGTIKEVIYLGDSIKYVLKISEDEEINVKVLNPSAQEQFAVGDTVQVVYKKENMLALAE